VTKRHTCVVHSFGISSALAAPPEVVWRHVTSMDGVNRELRPLLRMTVPPGLAGTTLDELPTGRRAGRSWLLLLGFVPVDFDDITIVEHGPGHRFLERSAMGSQSRWEHERTVKATDSGCRVVDRLGWQGRLAPLGALYRLAVPIVFRHRHRRLRRRFGAPRQTYD
jgi:ligand-binding SRPBCC domain-containing protein